MLLIRNIKQLLQVTNKPILRGQEMNNLSVLEDAYLLVEDDQIKAFGPMKDCRIEDWPISKVIDATGKIVSPAWCDSHTHIVYAGSREQEFVDRINGLSYEDIAARGGGILNSSQKLAYATMDELIENALGRIKEMMLLGTGAIEIKSGYGLSLDSELKMLRVIKELSKHTDVSIKSTFLGAHAIPVAYKNNRRGYIDLIKNEMIPAIASENLADYCDVFCEQNYFTKEETVEILEEGLKYGLIPKVHANQLSCSGGVQAGVSVGAISVDHLEYVGEAEINTLLQSRTMPTVLPGAAFFLGLPLPPARQMIDAGLPVAVATDYNPGSSPCGSMPFMMSLLCIQYKLTPAEAISAATLNSAYAMGIHESHGSIEVGKKANLLISKAIPSYDFLPYSFASNQIDQVILKGKIQDI